MKHIKVSGAVIVREIREELASEVKAEKVLEKNFTC